MLHTHQCTFFTIRLTADGSGCVINLKDPNKKDSSKQTNL